MNIRCRLVKSVDANHVDSIAVVTLPATPRPGEKVMVYDATGGAPSRYEVKQVAYEAVDERYSRANPNVQPGVLLAVTPAG